MSLPQTSIFRLPRKLIGLLGLGLLLAPAPARAAISVFEVKVSKDGMAALDGQSGPGFDNSATNSIVRSLDRIEWLLTLGADGTQTDSVTFEFTLPLASNGAVAATWDVDQATALCTGPGGGTVTNSGRTLRCDTGSRNNREVVGYALQSNVTNLPNGATIQLNAADVKLTTTQQPVARSVAAVPTAIRVSAAPRWDLHIASSIVYGNYGPANAAGWRLVYDYRVVAVRRIGSEPIGPDLEWDAAITIPNLSSGNPVIPPGKLVRLSDCGGSGGTTCSLTNFSNSTPGSVQFHMGVTGLNSTFTSASGGTGIMGRSVVLFVARTDLDPAVAPFVNYPLDETTTYSAVRGVSTTPNADPNTGNQNSREFLTIGTNFGLENIVDVPSKIAAVGSTVPLRVILTQAGTEPLSGILCEKIDTTRMTISGAAAVDNNAGGVTTTIEYGITGSVRSRQGWATISNVNTLGVNPSVSTGDHAGGTCNDGDSAPTWYPSLAAVQADGHTLNEVTKVRVKFGEIRADNRLNLQLRVPTLLSQTYIRSAYDNQYGTLIPGQDIKIPSYVPTQAWAIAGSTLQPNPPGIQRRHSDAFQVDGRAVYTRVDKQTISPTTPFFLGGQQVTYRLSPNQTSRTPPLPGTVTITDILPSALTFVSSSPAPNSIAPNTPFAGVTTLTWVYPNVTPPQAGPNDASGALPTIDVVAQIATTLPNDTVVRNDVAVSGNLEGSTHRDDIEGDCGYTGTSRFGGCVKSDSEQRRVAATIGFKTDLKAESPLTTPSGDFTYKLVYAQVGGSAPSAVTFISILPFRGDGTADLTKFRESRDAPSSFPATVTLNTVTRPTNDTSMGLAYTKAVPTTINLDALDASNQTGGSTVWCDQPASSTPGCPASLSEVTAVRMRPVNIVADTTYSVSISLRSNGNPDGSSFTLDAYQTSDVVTVPIRTPEAKVTVKGGSLAGSVFSDDNASTARDPSEIGLADAVVSLTLTAPANRQPKLYVKTGADGRYKFGGGATVYDGDPTQGGQVIQNFLGLNDGRYSVELVTRTFTGYGPGKQRIGSLGGVLSGLYIVANIPMTAGAEAVNYEFGQLTPVPTPSLTSPSNGTVTVNPRPAFSGRGEPGTTVIVEVDGRTVCSVDVAADGSWSCDPFDDLTDALHEVSAYAVRGNNPRSASTGVVSFRVDTKPPETVVDTAPPATVRGTIVTIGVTATDPEPSSGGVVLECSVDGAAFAPCPLVGSNIVGFTGLADGSHTIAIRGRDAAGNVDDSPASVTFVVDRSPPALAIVSPADGSAFRTGPTSISGTTDANATVTVTLDGQALCTATADAAGAWSCPITQTLGEGAHQAVAIAKDAAGNSSPVVSSGFVVDTRAPNAPIVRTPANGTAVKTSPTTVTGTAEPGSTVTVKIDGTVVCTAVADSVTGVWSCAVTQSLADGEHAIEATAADRAGNVSRPTQTRFFIDGQVPDTAIDQGPTGTVSVQRSDFTVRAIDPDPSARPVKFECSLDGAAFALCPGAGLQTTFGITAGNGQHTLRVRAVDAAGNVDPTPAERSWTVASTAPNPPTITQPVDGSTIADRTPVYRGTADANSRVDVSVDGHAVCSATADAQGAWTCESTLPVADGLRPTGATASVGGNSSAATSIEYTVDTFAPETTIDLGPDAVTRAATIAFAFSASENTATFECALDDGDFAACSSPTTYATLADGAHRFEVRAADGVGNLDATPALAHFRIARRAAAPLGLDIPLANQALPGSPAQIAGTAAPGTVVKVTDTGAAVCTVTADATGKWSCAPAQPLVDGVHSLRIEGTDATGVAQTPVVTSITVDSTTPTTAFTASPPATRAGTEAVFAFSSSESDVTYECRLDTPAFTSCSNPFRVTNLDPGAHTFVARAVDAAGNVDGTTAIHNWDVDATAAGLAIDSPANGASTKELRPTLRGRGTAGGTVAVSLDGTVVCATAAVAADASWSCALTADLAEGAHAITAVVGGNTVRSAITADRTAPDTRFIAAPGSLFARDSVRVTFGSDSVGVSYACALDAAAFAPCSANKSFTALAAGSHTIKVKAIDAAGNEDATPAEVSFLVATSGATPQLVAPQDGASYTAAPTFSGVAPVSTTVKVTLDGTVLASCASLVPDAQGRWTCSPGQAAGRGVHALLVELLPAGLAATATFVVDDEAPDTRLLVPADAKVGSETALVLGSAASATTFQCSLDAAAYAPCPATVRLQGLPSGNHTFRARAVDAAGNFDATPVEATFSADAANAGPVTVGVPLQVSAVTTKRPTFEGKAPAAASVRVLLDGAELCASATASAQGAWSCAATADLTDGPHLVEAAPTSTGTDKFGASAAFILDTRLPDTSFLRTPPKVDPAGFAEFELDSDEANLSFECSLDRATFTACSDPFRVDPLATGDHRLEVRARDAAGNADASPAVWEWRGGQVITVTSSSGSSGSSSSSGSSGSSSGSSSSSGSVGSTGGDTGSTGTGGNAGTVEGAGLFGCNQAAGSPATLALFGLIAAARRRRRS